jgi:hypothetical protein
MKNILIIQLIHLIIVFLITLSNVYVLKSKLANDAIKENKYLQKSSLITILNFILIFSYSNLILDNNTILVSINLISTFIILYYPIKSILCELMGVYVNYEIYNNTFENKVLKKLLFRSFTKNTRLVKSILFLIKLFLFLLSYYLLYKYYEIN